ncbi:hypothetical protein XENTR_v10023582 [Xenopus tropicalis]|nr:hypothetical protein XENTR_v10023582 [Xenopus tropicalis]
MENQTIVPTLVFTGLSDLPSLQLPLFLVFLLIYLITLTGNLLILLLIFTDSHLHTPMYFFLGTLACLDMSYSSVTVPRMLFDLLNQKRVISIRACLTQVFFFMFLGASEVSVLAVMSCDRYIAICRPLHYMQIMTWRVCVQLLSIILGFGLLLQVSCSDTFNNVLLMFLLAILFGVGILGGTFYPYIPIITTVLKMTSKHTRAKAFSTCSSHLTVVFIFYSAAFFNYFRSYSNDHYSGDKVASVVYAILTPFVNPMIYSLRNQELKSSLKKSFARSGNPNWTKTGL